MIAHARETEHENITRGLAMDATLVFNGREDDAIHIINTMLEDESKKSVVLLWAPLLFSTDVKIKLLI